MKLIAQIKLNPNNEQMKALKQTSTQANNVCNAISAMAWDSKIFGQFALHKLCYNTIRIVLKAKAQKSLIGLESLRAIKSEFCCVECGHNENAFLNAAKNIAYRAMNIYKASVNVPIAVRLKSLPSHATGTVSLAL